MAGQSKKCAKCGRAFEASHGAQKFCSGECVRLHRNDYHSKRRAGEKKPAKAGCEVCGKPYEKSGNQKTCSPECSEELRIRYLQDYYDADAGDDTNADGKGGGKRTKYRETATRKRIEAAGTVQRTCVICRSAFTTHDRRRKTCSRKCSTANSSGPEAVREAVMAAVRKTGRKK